MREVTTAQIARAVADAARSVEGVRDLHGGTVGAFATYSADGKITGVRVHDQRHRVEVRLVADFGQRLPELGDRVRQAARDALDRLGWTVRTVDVDVADVVVEPDPTPAAELGAGSKPHVAGGSSPPGRS